jgi:hypothetical protein
VNTESCPFTVGEIVTFRPTDYDLAKLSAMELYGIEPNDTGKIVRIENDRYIYLAKSKPGIGLDWEMFTRVERG